MSFGYFRASEALWSLLLVTNPQEMPDRRERESRLGSAMGTGKGFAAQGRARCCTPASSCGARSEAEHRERSSSPSLAVASRSDFLFIPPLQRKCAFFNASRFLRLCALNSFEQSRVPAPQLDAALACPSPLPESIFLPYLPSCPVLAHALALYFPSTPLSLSHSLRFLCCPLSPPHLFVMCSQLHAS